ncbi:NUDIX hydrolase N-terminal domain-containing protein [Sphingobacterium sp. LRF_L2]|uniref:NUDIX hydrolase N-terminal domain-containing protein n=1 Tax=Sphingobacterium sp. LRF_L2 TaxID=3369421 RepID=UPI003F63841E
MKKLKMVIFDLDGTLANTLPLCIRAFKESIEPLAGRVLSDAEIIATFGPSEEGTIRALLPANHHEGALLQYYNSYVEFHDMVPDCFEGIVDLLSFLEQQGVLITMVTGKGERSANLSLEKFGIRHYFKHVETGNPEGPSKEKGIRNILENYGLLPSEVIYVGDAPSDITAARNCEVPMVAVTWASTTDREALANLNPDYLFDTVDEFSDYLRDRISELQNSLFTSLKKMKALADTGLVYSQDDYNRERYEELKEITLTLMADMAGVELKKFKDFYVPVVDYPTPKVDVRAFILNENNEVLLVQEKQDSCWSLPGGWADIGSTPKESVLKEIYEEIGHHANVERLIAVFDKKVHPHPPQPFYVYKMVFLCSLTDAGKDFKIAFDTLDVQYFSINNLPPLSQDRIVESQIKLLFDQLQQQGSVPLCD